eukprot:16443356-Heterocapsa_arctica.AAC.1
MSRSNSKRAASCERGLPAAAKARSRQALLDGRMAGVSARRARAGGAAAEGDDNVERDGNVGHTDEAEDNEEHVGNGE